MIETLTTSLALFEVNRNRWKFIRRQGQRRAILICSGIVGCLSVAAYLWIIYW